MKGAICGGVISESKFNEDPMAYMMALVLPDEWHEKYMKLIEEDKIKEAREIIERYARSMI